MKILITGGAGFIGSNLVKAMLQHPQIDKVRVLDNFATGFKKNLEPFLANPSFEFIEGDIRKLEDCLNACKGMDAVCHQAALGSVPRSINDPLQTHDVNVNGFVNMLDAARINNIKRFVYASSSSVYGDLTESPKVETKVGKVLSPYASTKMTNELYAESYAKCYGMTICGFRYFNVFGPNQDPNGPYAAVIPLFIKSALTHSSPTINGDGTITRDFTPVTNVVNINISGLLTELVGAKHYVFNVACGNTTNLNDIWKLIKDLTNSGAEAIHGPQRPGDILFSLADINHAKQLLNYEPESDLHKEMVNTIEWYKLNIANS
jgi:UDP-N-acetylglucosamine 4-epimerase